MTEEAPLVSFIMSMQNASDTVQDTIRSLQWQTLIDWELVLLDDGSTDNSVAIINAISDRRIRLYGDSQRKGLAARLNQAVGLARGRYIARIDADDICFPARLEMQVKYLECHPSIDLVGTAAVMFSEDGPIGVLPVVLDHRDIVRRPFHGFTLPHPTWCGRAEWFRANPYDASLRRAQEQDLLLRTFMQSTFAALPDVLIGYRQRRLEMRKLLRGRWIFVRSAWRYGRTNGAILAATVGGASHVAKAMVDILTLSLGLNRWAQRRRLRPLPQSLRDEWLSLWAQLRAQ
jgi:glycosyltransferase involved in cell wall biosynthesis